MRGTMKTGTTIRLFAGLVLFGVLALPLAALADLTVKEQVGMSGMMGMMSSKGSETTYIKSDKMRSESNMEMGGMMGAMGGQGAKEQVTITRLDKGVMWFFGTGESTYTEISLKGEKADDAAAQIKVKAVTVKKTGQTKQITGFKCDGVLIETTVEVAPGKDELPITQSVQVLFWMRPEVKDLQELRSFWEQTAEMWQASQGAEGMGDQMKLIWDKMKEIQGVPLGMEMTMENPMGKTGAGDQDEMKEAMKAMQQYMKSKGKAPAEEPKGTESDNLKITREVVSISKGALSDALFEVPKGYKKVTQNMPEMMKGMGK